VPTITITIEVPEGVAVAVGGQRAAPSAGPFPKPGSDVCPEHNEPWKHVPAGVSKKTGKSYNAFWACPEMGCNARPAIGWKPPVQDIAPGGDDFDEVPF
jgi:hypothetical protein